MDVLDGQVADWLVIGSDLNSALPAAQLAKQGDKVLIIEPSENYGGPVHATLKHKQYLVDLTPMLLWANGNLAQELLSLGLGPSLDLIKLNRLAVYEHGQVRSVPRGREDIFMDPTISLPHKRLLWRTLSTLYEGDGSLWDLLQGLGLPADLISALVYGACLCRSQAEAHQLTIAESRLRLQSFYQAAQSYNMATPWLYPVYGSSELSQLLCRRASIHGATILLDVMDLTEKRERVVSGRFRADGMEWSAKYKQRLDPVQYPPSCSRWSFAVETGFMGDTTSSLFVLLSLHTNPIYWLQLASESACCPPGTLVVHTWTEGGVDLSSLLAPFVDNVLEAWTFDGLFPTPNLKS